MRTWFWVVVALLAACTESLAQVPRIALSSVPLARPPISQPVFLTHAHDGSGRVFVIEQSGRIVLPRLTAGPQLAVPVFLDIRSRVLFGGERGLLGLAFHPQFAINRRFFVNYTRAGDGATVIAEYRASATNPNLAETEQTVLLTIPQPFDNHNGGMIEFGPDGQLYIGMGDGGSANDPGNRAQNPNEFLGKMLRLNVDTGQVEIFASGFRNPWRFSFDRATGELWAGDVGQSAREEVDIVRQGGNYGWRVMEGTRCTGNGPGSCTAPGFIPPITEYANTGASGRCSITGGYVYRGSLGSFPYGAYVFGDYCSGEIFMWKDGVQSLLLDTTLNISSFGEDETGEIYVVGTGGTIARIFNPDAVTALQRDFSLPDRGAISWIAGEGLADLNNGYARIQSGGGGLPGGVAIYGLRRGGVLVSETSVPISPLLQSARIYAEVGAAVSTGIAIANPNAAPVSIAFYFTDANGQDFGGGATVLQPGEQVARFLEESPFNATGPFRGSFTFTSSALVSAVALRGFTNERSEFLFTNLPVSQPGASTGEVFFPQYADGGGWTTEFLLTNPTDAPISGTLQSTAALSLNGQNGSVFPYTIPARSSRRFLTAGGAEPTKVGAVRVAAAANDSTPSGVALFRFRTGSVTVTEGGVPATGAATAFRTYAEVAGALESGLAIANPSGAAATVTLALSPLSGGPAAYTGTIVVPASGQASFFLDEVPGFGTVSPPYRGVLRITSPSPIAVTALRGRTNERGEFLITATTPDDEAASDSSSELLFPHFAVGDGYETQFVLFNTRSAQTQSGAIYFFSDSGLPKTLQLR